MTGVSPRTHGDRDFGETKPMPDLPTMAQTFRDAGYQAHAVGKLHVYPPRARAGFDEVILCEEGRPQLGPTDDYELYLGEQGLACSFHGRGARDSRWPSAAGGDWPSIDEIFRWHRCKIDLPHLFLPSLSATNPP